MPGSARSRWHAVCGFADQSRDLQAGEVPKVNWSPFWSPVSRHALSMSGDVEIGGLEFHEETLPRTRIHTFDDLWFTPEFTSSQSSDSGLHKVGRNRISNNLRAEG